LGVKVSNINARFGMSIKLQSDNPALTDAEKAEQQPDDAGLEYFLGHFLVDVDGHTQAVIDPMRNIEKFSSPRTAADMSAILASWKVNRMSLNDVDQDRVVAAVARKYHTTTDINVVIDALRSINVEGASPKSITVKLRDLLKNAT